MEIPDKYRNRWYSDYLDKNNYWHSLEKYHMCRLDPDKKEEFIASLYLMGCKKRGTYVFLPGSHTTDPNNSVVSIDAGSVDDTYDCVDLNLLERLTQEKKDG